MSVTVKILIETLIITRPTNVRLVACVVSFWFPTSHLFWPLFAEVLRQSALSEVLDVFHSLHFSTKWTEQFKQNDS